MHLKFFRQYLPLSWNAPCLALRLLISCTLHSMRIIDIFWFGLVNNGHWCRKMYFGIIELFFNDFPLHGRPRKMLYFEVCCFLCELEYIRLLFWQLREMNFALMKTSMTECFHGAGNLQKTFHTLSSLFWQRKNGKPPFCIQCCSAPVCEWRR